MAYFRNNCLTPLMAWLMVWLSGSAAFSQTVSGTISGTVVDSSGAIIAGAAIRLVNEQTANVRTLTTNDEGRFSFPATQPGTYTIKIAIADVGDPIYDSGVFLEAHSFSSNGQDVSSEIVGSFNADTYPT